ncbi:MAG: hypothetical protein CVU50_05880 [Candidatus Cloacimonetes bacterium HGW-Cloacimonetes-3]|nr:MAG: hypothetical protein CVU50_05880 [Candidatus Cloacimonetes bacterium HGW-Cloacimonetes-3]
MTKFSGGNMRKTLFLFVLILASMGLLWGQYSIAATSTTYTQNFDTLANTGTGITWSDGTTLSGWYAKTDATASIVTYGTNTGTTTTAGLYAFGTASATDRAFGYAASNTYFGAAGTGKGYMGWRLKNNTPGTITTLTVTWTGEEWRKENNATAQTLSLTYQTGTTVTDMTAGTWTTASSVFTSPIFGATTATALDGNLAANRVVGIVATISGLSLASGDEIMIRWEDLNDSGNDHQLAIDDVSVSATGGAPSPVINVTGTLNAFSTTTGTPSASQSYTLSGSSLTGNINVAALAGYAYSTDDTNWSSTLSLASSFSGLVYVRLTGAAVGTYSGDIVHSSTGATPVNLAASGTVSDPTPTITLGGTLVAFTTIVGTPSAYQSYTVAGTFLTANISIAAVAGYEYCLTSGGTYTSTLSLPHTGGTVATTTIYVRLTGATIGTYDGNIAHTSTGATQQDKAVTGSVTAAPSAETFFEDNFEYTATELLTANGWTAHSGGGTNSFFVSNAGLSHPGYPANSGLAAETTGTSGEDVNRLFTAQTSGSVYASVLVNISAAALAGDYFFHLGANPLGSDYKGRVFAQVDGSDMLRFGVSRGGDKTTAIWTGYNYSLDSTYLLVLKYTIVAGAANDQVALWVNPTIGPTEPAYNVLATDTAATDAANIGAVALRQGNTSNPTPVAKYDGIRITNSWAQLWTTPVVPVLHVGTPSVDPLACIINTPSEEIRSYTLYGQDTSSQIVVTAPTGFQVATSETGVWESVLNLASDFNGTIYVRMFATAVGDYEGNIVHTSGSAVPVNVGVSGECFPPDVVWNITGSLTAFSSQAGTPSANQSYTLGTTTATGDITVATTAPFQLSTTGTGGWATELVLPYSFNATIYVRMNSASAGDFTADITHTTADASPNVIHISGNATPAAGYAYDLFFSEYLEGSGNSKAIEIFNGTGAPVDLSDYRYENWYNGGSSPSTYTFSGTLAHGEAYVVANPSSITEILALADATSGNISFNGDDALVLRKISTDAIVDIFGVIGQDPGTQWTADGGYTTIDKTLVRKSTVIRGITVNPTISDPAVTTDFVTLSTEWDMYDINTYSNLGIHTFGTGGILDTPVVTITETAGNVVLDWTAVTGATGGYRIESSDDPYTGFSLVTTTSNLTWSGAASSAKKFYRVIALP